MQRSFMGSLMELSAEHDNIMYLTADSGEGGLELMYKRNFPDCCYNFGIAEENMVAAAAGMALCGKVPFVYTAAPFLAYRSFEFIRDDLCLQNVPVKLFGSGSGISVSSLGPTHHATEDIAVLNSLPNLTVLSPATPKQAYESVRVAYEIEGPVYVRLGMNNEKEYFGEDYRIPAGGFEVLREGKDIGIVSTGSMLKESMDVAEMLEKEGVKVSVANAFSIKPFDSDALLEFASNVDCLFSVEEHNICGGLGTLIADVLIASRMNKHLIKIGLEDTFAQGYGSIDLVRCENGLDAISIANRIRKEIS